MLALILAVAVSASGDPYARCLPSDQCGLRSVPLTTTQRTTLVNHVTSQAEWSSIAPNTIVAFECDFSRSPAQCRPWYNVTVSTGADIIAVILATGKWQPGADTNTYMVPAAWKDYTGTLLTQAQTHVRNVAANQQDISGLPLLGYEVKRTIGDPTLRADIGYKAEANAAWCLAHIAETIIMDGVVP